MKFDRDKRYARINSILQEDGIDILKFKQEFAVEIATLSEDDMKYHEKYISANYDLIDWMISEEEQKKFKVKKEPFKAVPVFVNEKLLSVELVESVSIGEEVVHILTKDFEEDDQERGPDPSLSRKEQVRYWIEKGVTSTAIIADSLGANPSYVARLKKEIENEDN